MTNDTEKSAIIYEPNFIINNNEILTSLCIYFDELILISNKPLDDEETEILDEKKDGFQKKIKYINNVLRPLMAEQIITMYDIDTINNMALKSNELVLGDIEIEEDNNRLNIKINSLSNNNISHALFDLLHSKNTTVADLTRVLCAYSLSTEYHIPVATARNHYPNGQLSAESLSSLLALKVLCNFALPQLNTSNPEDIIDIRNELKDELIEFKAGILDLTYLLYQNIKAGSNLQQDIVREIEMLVNTKIKSSIISLEHNIYTNKKKSFSNIVLSGGKLIISGALMALGLGNKINTLSNGLNVLQSLSDLTSSYSRPEDRIASYVLQLNKRTQ